MSIYAVTTIRNPGVTLLQQARIWARDLHLPLIPRPLHGSMETFLAKKA